MSANPTFLSSNGRASDFMNPVFADLDVPDAMLTKRILGRPGLGKVTSCAINESGSIILTATDCRWAYVFGTAPSHIMSQLDHGTEGPIEECAITRSGHISITSGRGSVKAWKSHTGRLMWSHTYSEEAPICMRAPIAIPDQVNLLLCVSTMWTGSHRRSLKCRAQLIDLDYGAVIREYPLADGWGAQSCAISDDGTRIAVFLSNRLSKKVLVFEREMMGISQSFPDTSHSLNQQLPIMSAYASSWMTSCLQGPPSQVHMYPMAQATTTPWIPAQALVNNILGIQRYVVVPRDFKTGPTSWAIFSTESSRAPCAVIGEFHGISCHAASRDGRSAIMCSMAGKVYFFKVPEASSASNPIRSAIPWYLRVPNNNGDDVFADLDKPSGGIEHYQNAVRGMRLR